MFFIHYLSLPDLHPYADGIKSTWNVSRLCSLRSKTWFLHHDCHRNNIEEGLWNTTLFFFYGSRVNVWIYGHKTVFSSIWTLPGCFNWCFSSFKYPRSGTLKKGIMLSSRTDFLVFFSSPLYLSTQHFCPILFVCSQSSVSLDCIWNYRSSYHSLKRLVCPALCILAVLSNP